MPHPAIKTSSKQPLLSLVTFLFAMCVAFFANAELEELDDKKMDELTGKEGITIDLSYKLSIGEIAIDFSDKDFDAEKKRPMLTAPPSRIEYHHGKN